MTGLSYATPYAANSVLLCGHLPVIASMNFFINLRYSILVLLWSWPRQARFDFSYPSINHNPVAGSVVVLPWTAFDRD